MNDITLNAGGQATFGKFTLSLGQQCDAFNFAVNKDNPKEIQGERVAMLPIYSGPTSDSTNTYSIKTFLDTNGSRKDTFNVKELVGPHSTTT